jgi:hypothetical protein
MTIDMLDGTHKTIPGECYGNASDVSEWLRKNLGNQLEVLS